MLCFGVVVGVRASFSSAKSISSPSPLPCGQQLYKMLTESSFAFRKWCFSRTKEKDATDATGGAPAQAALRQLYFQVPRGTARGLCALGRAVMMLWCRGVACLGEGGGIVCRSRGASEVNPHRSSPLTGAV